MTNIKYFLIGILILFTPGEVSANVISKGDLRYIEVYYTPFNYCARRPIQKTEIEKICRYKLIINCNSNFSNYDNLYNVLKTLQILKKEEEDKIDYRAKIVFHYTAYDKIIIYCSINQEIIFNGSICQKEEKIISLISVE